MKFDKFSLNDRSAKLLKKIALRHEQFRIEVIKLPCGTTIYDFGVDVVGSLQAGLALAKVCLADLAAVTFLPADPTRIAAPLVQVLTDAPVAACMASQYAGWPVKVDKFFAMGSGPMRIKRGKEKVLQDIQVSDSSNFAVGVLETEKIPDDAIAQAIAAECQVSPDALSLCVAPTRSIAGVTQVVSRAVETALHKIDGLGGDVNCIISAIGTAPKPPPTSNFAAGIGRTNDAILYGGDVTLYTTDGSHLLDLIEKIPSNSSSDWGSPFIDIFNANDCDFYKIDAGLFAPARLTIIDVTSGSSRTAGLYRPDCLKRSFGLDS